MSPSLTLPDVNTERLLNTFLDLVRLDSPSGHEEPVQAFMVEQFTRLGLSPFVDAAGNVIATFASANPNAPTVIFTGHMDVVPPCLGVNPQVTGSGLERLITTDGTTVLGADDKSALAAILEAIELSKTHNTPRPNVLLLITVEEETFLQGAKGINPDMYRHANFGVAFDHTGHLGTLIHQAPTYLSYKLTVFGKSVHAGIMPEKGINAITLLSEIGNQLPWGRLDDDTTANFGTIQGGKATNIVPDKATVEGEVRSHNPQCIQDYVERIHAVANTILEPIESACYELTTDRGFEAYRTDPNHPYIKATAELLAQHGHTPELIRSNGGSDINVFTQLGVPGIVLSAGYVDPHTLKERVTLKDMADITQIILGLWECYARLA